jgi:hypothetical protein
MPRHAVRALRTFFFAATFCFAVTIACSSVLVTTSCQHEGYGKVPAFLALDDQRSMVPDRLIFFCNSITPYSSASAVGGQPGT